MSAKRYAVLLAVIFLLTVSGTVAIHSPRISAQLPASPPSHADDSQLDVPIADFNLPEPADPDRRAKRKLRAKRHNLLDKNLSPEEAARFALRERDDSLGPQVTNGKKTAPTEPPPFKSSRHDFNPPVPGGAVTDESPPEQALPTHISDAVVIGQVIDANAHVSEDKTSVYSEFAVQVAEVLESSGAAPLAPGLTATVLRPGGGVRIPSGRVRKFVVDGRSLPRVGRRYVLFLKYDNLAGDFYIVTGYELRDGKVLPLDGVPKYGNQNHPFGSYGKYVNADETAFLEDVRRAIIAPPPQAPGGFPIHPTDPEGGV